MNRVKLKLFLTFISKIDGLHGRSDRDGVGKKRIDFLDY